MNQETPNKPRLLIYAAAWWIFGAFWDELSSGIKKFPNGYEESNALARSVDGAFLWRHAVIYDSITFLVFMSFAIAVYSGLGRRHKWAEWPGAMVFFYYGFTRYFAAINNLYIRLGWYNPSVDLIIRKFL